MGGLFFDVWLEVLLREAVRWVRTAWTRNWLSVPGEVSYTETKAGLALPNHVVLVVYSYSVAEAQHSDEHKKAFLFEPSAVNYAARFESGSTVTVRVNPRNPEQSFFCEGDQAIRI